MKASLLRKKVKNTIVFVLFSYSFAKEIAVTCSFCETNYWAKIPSVTDASAPRFHQCSPNYKYQQLLSFMAV